MKLFNKFSVRILWALLVSALPQILKGQTLTTSQEDGLELGKKIGDDVAKVFTDDNPDDKAQLHEVYEKHKKEIVDVSLELVDDFVEAKVKNPKTKAIAVAAIATLKKVVDDEWQDDEQGLKYLQAINVLPEVSENQIVT
jgi:hypothetical protein